MRVEGRIVSEGGEPIEDLLVTYTESRVDSHGWGLKTSESKTVDVAEDGRFVIQAGRVFKIDLTVSAPGHHRERHSIAQSYRDIGDRVKRKTEGEEVERPEVVETGYVIQLEQRINPVPMHDLRDQIHYTLDGAGTLFTYREGLMEKSTQTAKALSFLEYADAEELKELPPGVVVSAPIREDGTGFETKHFMLTRVNARPLAWSFPEVIRLTYTGDDGGFIHVPQSVAGDEPVLAKFLREAPKDGYTKEIVISAKELVEDYYNLGYAPHYYVKINGFYGILFFTNRLDIRTAEEGVEYISAGPIQFRMQPDGGRNVEAEGDKF